MEVGVEHAVAVRSPVSACRVADPILPRGADKTAGLQQCGRPGPEPSRSPGASGGPADGVAAAIRENMSKAAERSLASRAA